MSSESFYSTNPTEEEAVNDVVLESENRIASITLTESEAELEKAPGDSNGVVLPSSGGEADVSEEESSKRKESDDVVFGDESRLAKESKDVVSEDDDGRNSGSEVDAGNESYGVGTGEDQKNSPPDFVEAGLFHEIGSNSSDLIRADSKGESREAEVSNSVVSKDGLSNSETALLWRDKRNLAGVVVDDGMGESRNQEDLESIIEAEPMKEPCGPVASDSVVSKDVPSNLETMELSWDQRNLAAVVVADRTGESMNQEELKSIEHSVEEQGRGVLERTVSELEVEGPLSPGSSGYAGERGSSSSGASGIDEIEESRSDDFVGLDGASTLSNSQSSSIPEKQHVDEDDTSISWRKRKKHFLFLSHSGKPIFSRYGDEHKLAGFSATLQAIVSFVENGRDRIKLVRAGNHQVIFVVKGPIYLVCISCTEEPYESLREQLELLYGQMTLILTKSVNRYFEKNPKFDMTPLLGGTDAVFSSLIHSFSWNPATFLHAYTCVPLAYSTRQAAGSILQEIAGSTILCALIMCKHKVVSLGAQKASLHPDDLLLLANFVMSSESFRTSESFSPICLPRYNPFAFLYAYVHYFDEDTYLILLTTSSDAFYHLKDCRIRIESVLLRSNVLSEVERSMKDGGMRVEDLPVDQLPRSRSVSSHLGHHKALPDSVERYKEPASGTGGVAGLWHFMYRSIHLDQYVSSEFSPPINNPKQQKKLYRAYQKLHAAMHDREYGPHKTQFRRDENYVLLCWVTQDFEFCAAFDPLADKAAAIKMCNRLCQWVKDVEKDIFLLGGAAFSW